MAHKEYSVIGASCSDELLGNISFAGTLPSQDAEPCLA